MPNDWSADGKFIVFEDNNRETGRDALDVAHGRRSHSQTDDPHAVPGVGRTVIAGCRVGRIRLQRLRHVGGVRGAPARTRREETHLHRRRHRAAMAARWQGSCFYVAPDTGSMMAVAITTNPIFTAGAPVQLFATPGEPASRRQSREVAYDVSPDGQSFVINTPLEQPPASGITVVLNWAAGLPH